MKIDRYQHEPPAGRRPGRAAGQRRRHPAEQPRRQGQPRARRARQDAQSARRPGATSCSPSLAITTRNASTSVSVQSLLSQLGATEQELATNESQSQQVLASLTTETGASVVSVPTFATGVSRHMAVDGALAGLLGLVLGLLFAALARGDEADRGAAGRGARELGAVLLRQFRGSAAGKIVRLDPDLPERLSLAAHRAGVLTIVLTGPGSRARLGALAARLRAALPAAGAGRRARARRRWPRRLDYDDDEHQRRRTPPGHRRRRAPHGRLHRPPGQAAGHRRHPGGHPARRPAARRRAGGRPAQVRAAQRAGPGRRPRSHRGLADPRRHRHQAQGLAGQPCSPGLPGTRPARARHPVRRERDADTCPDIPAAGPGTRPLGHSARRPAAGAAHDDSAEDRRRRRRRTACTRRGTMTDQRITGRGRYGGKRTLATQRGRTASGSRR